MNIRLKAHILGTLDGDLLEKWIGEFKEAEVSHVEDDGRKGVKLIISTGRFRGFHISMAADEAEKLVLAIERVMYD